jgi:elongation factor G
MKVYDAASIRNVAVVGHGGCGKTQLVSAMLFDAGMVNRLGRVDDGTTVTDYDDEEIARKHTLSASLATRVEQAQDQPHRHARLRQLLERHAGGLRVADAALVVVDAVAGVEVQTEKAWAGRRRARPAAPGRAQPARPRARLLERSLESLRQAFGPHRHPGPAADRRGEGLHAAWSTSCR